MNAVIGADIGPVIPSPAGTGSGLTAVQDGAAFVRNLTRGGAGDVVASTSTWAANQYGTSYTVPNAVTVDGANYGAFMRSLIDIQTGGVLRNNGGNGAAGGTAGAAVAAGAISGAAAAGGAGGTATGTVGASSTSSVGGAGGAGGNGTGGNGGAGGTASVPTPGRGSSLSMLQQGLFGLVSFGTSTVALIGGAGGGGGGGDGTAGGGGGAGAGGIVLCAPTINIDGSVQAIGGNGGTPAAGNRGGGGGGGGGYIVLIYASLTGGGAANCNVNGGTKGTKSGTGTDGVDGSAGNVIQFPCAA